MNILVVEDDLEICALVEYFFVKEGYSVKSVSDGLEALKALKKDKYDLMVLDIMLPSLDGKNITRIIREMPEEYGNPKIVMLSAKTEVEDILEGLTLGADDYMKKPFEPRELVLRSKKLLASKSIIEKSIVDNSLSISTSQEKEEKQNILKYKDIVLNKKMYKVTASEMEVTLTKKEYDLLTLLLENIGMVLTREKILDFVWGTDYFLGDRSVDVYISKLREKFPSISSYIKTIKGVGYKLEEEKE